MTGAFVPIAFGPFMSIDESAGDTIPGTLYSYVTVARAEDLLYFSLNSQTFASSDLTTQQQALVSATRLIDLKFDWEGTKTEEDQLLNWPRTGAYDCDGVAVPVDGIPEEIEMAVALLANYLIEQNSAFTVSTYAGYQGLKKVKIDGALEVEFLDSVDLRSIDQFPSYVRDWVKCFATPESLAKFGGYGTFSIYRGG